MKSKGCCACYAPAAVHAAHQLLCMLRPATDSRCPCPPLLHRPQTTTACKPRGIKTRWCSCACRQHTPTAIEQQRANPQVALQLEYPAGTHPAGSTAGWHAHSYRCACRRQTPTAIEHQHASPQVVLLKPAACTHSCSCARRRQTPTATASHPCCSWSAPSLGPPPGRRSRSPRQTVKWSQRSSHEARQALQASWLSLATPGAGVQPPGRPSRSPRQTVEPKGKGKATRAAAHGGEAAVLRNPLAGEGAAGRPGSSDDAMQGNTIDAMWPAPALASLPAAAVGMSQRARRAWLAVRSVQSAARN